MIFGTHLESVRGEEKDAMAGAHAVKKCVTGKKGAAQIREIVRGRAAKAVSKAPYKVALCVDTAHTRRPLTARPREMTPLLISWDVG